MVGSGDGYPTSSLSLPRTEGPRLRLAEEIPEAAAAQPSPLAPPCDHSGKIFVASVEILFGPLYVILDLRQQLALLVRQD